jgi:hypothetical protein
MEEGASNPREVHAKGGAKTPTGANETKPKEKTKACGGERIAKKE